MPTFERTYRVQRPASVVFDVIGTHVYENHPKWESEVVEIRPLSGGPVGLGSRAVMVRQEYGRRSEVVYEVTAFEPGRRIAFVHPDGSMRFELSFDLAPAGQAATDLTVRVSMEPRGAMRVLGPVLGMQLPGRSDRLTRSMIRLVETSAA